MDQRVFEWLRVLENFGLKSEWMGYGGQNLLSIVTKSVAFRD